MLRVAALSWIVLTGVLAGLAPAHADKRVALVIGNSTYRHVAPLPNPRNDAGDMAATLAAIGFEVRHAFDLDRAAMQEALAEFSDAAVGADIAVVFFAGHGIELDRRNYLVPVDARLEVDRRVRFEAVPLDDVEAALDAVNGIRIVLLDACRNNPFVSSMRMSSATRSVSRGLTRVEAPRGSLVSFAAREGTVADDGDGRNSPFTAALLANLAKPGIEISLLFRLVRDDVIKATDGRQEPFVSASLPGDSIYFVPPPDNGETTVPPAAGTPAPPPPDAAAEVWQSVQYTSSTGVLEAFIEAFPDSVYASFARARLRELEADNEDDVALGIFPGAPFAPRGIKLQTAYVADDPVLAVAPRDFAKEIARLSGGAVTVDVLPVGAEVPAFQVYEAVAAGTLDAGFSSAAYAYGKNRAFILLEGSVPFGLGPRDLVRWYEGKGQAVADDIYSQMGVKMLPCGIVGPQGGGWYDRPLTDGASFQGMLIRAVGIYADIFAAAGARVVQLPGGEIVPALERGIINSIEFAWPLSDLRLGLPGLKDRIPYYYYPAWHHPASMQDFVVSLDYWARLSAGEQMIFRQACRASLRRGLDRLTETEREGLDALRGAGVEVREFPQPVLDHVRRASLDVLRRLSAENPDFARVYDSMKRFR